MIAWPDAAALPRLAHLLGRLSSLPLRVGTIALDAVRDVQLPLPATWPRVAPPPADEVPDAVDGAWLAATLTGALTPDAALLALARRLRERPAWTLVACWLLEVALWPDNQTAAAVQAAVRGELGDLHCQAGDLATGLPLLDGTGRQCDEFRAACWAAAHGRDDAAVRLDTVLAGDGLPPADAWAARLELLGLDPTPYDDAEALLGHAHRVDGLIAQARQAGLSLAELGRLQARAHHLVGRWFLRSPTRQLRALGRYRLQRAADECERVGDQRAFADLLHSLGLAWTRLGAPVLARYAFEQCLALRQQLRDLWGLAATLHGQGELLLGAGQAADALACFQAGIRLLQALGVTGRVMTRTHAQQLRALLAAQASPLDLGRPDPGVETQARHLLAALEATLDHPGQDPTWLMLSGACHRLSARRRTDSVFRLHLLDEGVRQVKMALNRLPAAGQARERIEARQMLAALELDRARAVDERREPLAAARAALEEIERDSPAEAADLHTELLWAVYHQLADAPARMQLHLAAARRCAEASGSQALAGLVDARLGVRLTGPTDRAEAVVLIQPGETVPLEVRAADWRGRPLPSYALYANLEPGSGPAPDINPPLQRTDHLGRCVFELRAAAPCRALVQVGDRDSIHTAGMLVVAAPLTLERGDVALSIEEVRLLRQLFGPDCTRLAVRREFTGGRSGTRVLLMEAFRAGEAGGELVCQPCIVKLGPRDLLEQECERHERWVKEVLPLNVSRLDAGTVWGDRAALRLGLVGTTDGPSVRDLNEWLVGATPFEAHLLLERIFVGDLAPCWYANSPRREAAAPLAQPYGLMLPPLLALEDSDPPRGMVLRGRPSPPEALLDGLRVPGEREVQPGQERTLVGARVCAFRPRPGDRWEYELMLDAAPLRFTFQTAVRPEWIEPDGDPRRLLEGERAWSVRGRVVTTAYDHLAATLGRCLEVFNATHRGESVELTDDGRSLRLRDTGRGLERTLPCPLPWLVRLLGWEVPLLRSITHGDLHGRNVLVNAQGQPFYIDFARTGYGPTLFDFVKLEVYLWHDLFAGWPGGPAPAECGLAAALELLDDLSSPAAHRRFPSPFVRQPRHRPAWLVLLRQCLATLRSAARPYIIDPAERDYFAPLALYAGQMLRWCDPHGAAARQQARQGVFHTLAAAALLAGVLSGGERDAPGDSEPAYSGA